MANNNSFPLTFDATFQTGSHTSLSADPAEIDSQIQAVEDEVSSIDNITTVAHGINTVTVVIQYTP